MRRVLMVMLIATALVASYAGQASAGGPGDHAAADEHSQSSEHSQAHQSDVAAARRAANGVPNAVCETSGGINGVMLSGRFLIRVNSITDAAGTTVLGATVMSAPTREAFAIEIPGNELPGTFTVQYDWDTGNPPPNAATTSTSVSCGQTVELTGL